MTTKKPKRRVKRESPSRAQVPASAPPGSSEAEPEAIAHPDVSAAQAAPGR